MSQRKARLRRKATIRSRSNTVRLQRKGAHVIADERADAVEQQLREARSERDKSLLAANQEYRKALGELNQVLATSRKVAHEQYETKRSEILKAFAERAAA